MSSYPTSADLAAFRRSLGHDSYCVTDHADPDAEDMDWIGPLNAASNGAWPDEIKNGIGHLETTGRRWLAGTDGFMSARTRINRLRSADYGFHDFSAGAGQMSPGELEWWREASDTFVPEWGGGRLLTNS